MAKRGNSPRAQIPLRIPEALRAQLEKAAKAGNRSMNADISSRLEMSFLRPEDQRFLNLDDLIAAVKVRSEEARPNRRDGPSPNCGRCRYFVLSASKIGDGHCHCRAPVTDKRGAAEWPSVWGDYWCGEFRAAGSEEV